MSMIEAIESIGIPKSDVLRLVNMDFKLENREENDDLSKPGCGLHKMPVVLSARKETF